MDIKRAKEIHGNKYDYSLVNYKNNYTKVKIICPIHGVFEQTSNSHLSGHGCPKCNKFTHDDDVKLKNFIVKARLVHNNKYDYSLVDYKNHKTKVKIICPDHGVFWQEPKHHISGHGCQLCAYKKSSLKQSMGLDGFLQKARSIHGNRYDYSKVNYKNNNAKIIIICFKHGEFSQLPLVHLRGQNCPKCGRESTVKANISNTRDFIQKSHNIHGAKYDYNKVTYFNSRKNVTIVCPTHGSFSQSPITHLRGSGCRKCNGEWDRDIFVNKSNKVHCGRYDYSKVDYQNANVKVEIICPKHGPFWQSPSNHVNGSGCGRCSLTTVQNQVLSYVEQYCNVKSNDRTIIHPYELDIYVPFKSLAIEVNGIYWHSFDHRVGQAEKNKHLDKHHLCLSKNIQLLQIWDKEWDDKRSIVKSMIKSKLGLLVKINARECEFKPVDNKTFADFLIKNHLQGRVPTKWKFALYYNGEIVQVLGFNRHIKHECEISRFATKCGYVVVGGFTKLFKNGTDLIKVSSVMTFANKRYSTGGVYQKAGFKLINESKPNYFYVKNHNIYSRIKFQKHKLKKLLPNFDDSKSEIENMLNNGYRILWDAGNYQYLWIDNHK